jgi:hypothetical protein
MRFGTWNVRDLYRSGLFPAVARDLARQKLDLPGVQEIERDKGGTVRARVYIFVYGKEVKSSIGNRFVVHKIEIAVQGVEFFINRMYIVLRGCCFNIIVLNVHAASEENSYHSKDSFYE